MLLLTQSTRKCGDTKSAMIEIITPLGTHTSAFKTLLIIRFNLILLHDMRKVLAVHFSKQCSYIRHVHW
jgi:hypothetical protein